MRRHDVLPERALQQGLRELERAALVEVRVVWPVHPGHGKDVNAGGVAVFPIGETAQQVEGVTDLDGSATQAARLDGVKATLVAARRRLAEADELGEGGHAFLFILYSSAISRDLT